MTKLIGLGCTARIGKDYAAAELAKTFSVERIAFADELKADLATIFAKSGQNYYHLERTEKQVIRPLLVSYGQTMREFDPMVWVNRAYAKAIFDKEVTVVTDVRFPNEVDWLHSLGGTYIHVVAKDVVPANAVEAEYVGRMKDLADYRVINNFDSQYIKDLVSLANELTPCQPTPFERSKATPSAGISTNSLMLGSNLSFQLSSSGK